MKPNILLRDWIKDFQRNGSRKMSMRLYNLLFFILSRYDENIYVHEIEEQECRRMRNFGKKSWEEFIYLRGY
jgi:hypothetical protein